MKKTAIMQPYLFPYIGYFQLINCVDEFIVYDNIQFTKKGWFHRNRILNGNKEMTFTIPLKKDSDYLNVNERFRSVDSEKEIRRILSIIKNTYKKSPQFDVVYPIVEKIFYYDQLNLFNYIYNSIILICEYLNINTKITISSSIDIDHVTLKGQDKVIALCESCDTDIYINSIGGKDLYSKDDFLKHNIELFFLKPFMCEYNQGCDLFIPGLSIIDVMMFNSVEEINKMLDNYETK